MPVSEITEEKDEESPLVVGKERLRRILEYQKSLYLSSSSPSLYISAPSSSSFSSSQKSNSLLELMQGGSTSLRRLFDMEHTSLSNFFENYSGSPIVKAIPLWGSDADDEIHDPWASIKQVGPTNDSGTDGQNKAATEGSFMDGEFGVGNRKVKTSNHKLTRKKSYRRLPGFGLWRCRGFRFRLKLKRFRTTICARKF
ncbi:hypothetical protein ACJW31_09G071400 [Castanea mollissima]